ncbi:hypothetical protein GWI33_007046 [Rhynchophorus ferrugineus]|uniref:Uncharacterized protein n=1 Tax=Rhynchophorus ferrugineus TaxID=354439 RepID=A0A834IE07_RHYFE|nr:hypothetical protein GWI33_007046 [Rhynchophorus ferrugineus]
MGCEPTASRTKFGWDRVALSARRVLLAPKTKRKTTKRPSARDWVPLPVVRNNGRVLWPYLSNKKTGINVNFWLRKCYLSLVREEWTIIVVALHPAGEYLTNDLGRD